VLAGGLGALASLARWSDYPAHLRGLATYRSATYGDGIALPLLAALLLAAVQSRSLPPIHRLRRGRLQIAIGAGIGLCLGAAVQALWWLDPDPPRNWTLPAPHHFTLAGRWHATFLIAMSGVFAGLWVALLVKLRWVQAQPGHELPRLLRSRTAVWLTANAVFFTVLVALDNRDATATQATLTTAVAIAVVAVTLMASLAVACGAAALAALPSIGLGATIAAAGVVVVVQFPSSAAEVPAKLVPLLFVELTAAGVGFAMTHDATTPSWWERYLVATLFTLSGAAWLDHRFDSLLIPLALPAAAVAAAWLVRWRRDQRLAFARDFLAACGTSAVLLAIARAAVWIQQQHDQGFLTAGFILTVCGVIAGRLLFPHVRDVFQTLIDSEEQLGAGAGVAADSRAQHQAIAATAWQRTAGYAVAATSALVLLAIATAPSLGFRPGRGQPSGLLPFLCLAMAAVALAAPVMLLAHNP
jgi:hypothetical protein